MRLWKNQPVIPVCADRAEIIKTQRMEVNLDAVCTSTQRLNESQDQAGLQPDEAPAYLFQSGRPCGAAGVFPYPRRHRQLGGGAPYDRADDALFLFRHV